MSVALVMDAAPSDHFVAQVLTNAGWTVRSQPDVGGPAGAADVVVADLGVVLDRGWLEAGLGAPLVVTSSFADFLERVQPLVAGVIHLPSTAEAVTQVVGSAAAGAHAAAVPALRPSPYDDRERDRKIALLRRHQR